MRPRRPRSRVPLAWSSVWTLAGSVVWAVAIAAGGCTPEPKPAPVATTADAPAGAALLAELRQAKLELAENDARAILMAVKMHVLRKATCPPDLATLERDRELRKVPHDPWDRDYVLECTGDGASMLVISLGPDGERDTKDDIRVDDRGP